jgi:hypothetical protein
MRNKTNKSTKKNLPKKTTSINIKHPGNKTTSYKYRNKNTNFNLEKEKENYSNKIITKENPIFFKEKKSNKVKEPKFISSESLKNYNFDNFNFGKIKKEDMNIDIERNNIDLNVNRRKSNFRNKYESSLSLINFKPKSVKFSNELIKEVNEKIIFLRFKKYSLMLIKSNKKV